MVKAAFNMGREGLHVKGWGKRVHHNTSNQDLSLRAIKVRRSSRNSS